MTNRYQGSSLSKQRGLNYIYLFVAMFVVIAGYFAYKAYQSYSLKAAKAELARQMIAKQDAIKSTLVKWDDARNLAGMTARISLAQPLSQMQSIRRDLSEIRSNECFNSGADKIVSGMNDAITAFEFFIRFPNSPTANETTAKYFSQSEASIIDGQKIIENCIKQ